jgi:hypothetical protein
MIGSRADLTRAFPMRLPCHAPAWPEDGAEGLNPGLSCLLFSAGCTGVKIVAGQGIGSKGRKAFYVQRVAVWYVANGLQISPHVFLGNSAEF